MRATCLCLAALASLTVGGTLLGGGKDGVEGDLKKIQGTWKFVAQEVNGKERPKDQIEGIIITFAGDKWTVRQGDKVLQGGTHKLDGSRKPAHADAMVTEGEGKDTKMLGIYELKGDTLKVCFDVQGKVRPTSFTAGAGQMAVTVQREKKKS